MNHQKVLLWRIVVALGGFLFELIQLLFLGPSRPFSSIDV